jgi:glycerophosphoryl diester phosphodiesterase
LNPEGAKKFATPDAVRVWKGIVNGFGPDKSVVASNPAFVKWAHAENLIVTPYTFRADQVRGYASAKAEMAHFLYELGVDGLFTNNPDQFPRN